MATGNLDQLLVKIDASTELLRRELKRGSDGVDKFSRTATRKTAAVERRFQALGKSVKRSMAGFAAALSITALTRFTQSAIAAGDAVGKAAQTAGIAPQALQELRFAFGQLAGTMDREVDESIRRFTRRLGLAAEGGGPAKDAFGELGVSIKDMSGNLRDGQTVLDESLRALAAIENPALRAAKASEIFGEDAGPKLAAALGNGIEAMETLRDVTPGVLSDEQVSKAEGLTDAFDRMAKAVGGTLKGAFIDATAAMAQFFGVAESFRTAEDLSARILELENALASRRRGRGRNRSSAESLAEDQAEIDALRARLTELFRGGGSGGGATAGAAAASLDSINAGDFITQRSTVGANLLEGMPDVRAASLKIIEPGELTEFQQQLKDMRGDVDAVRESVEFMDEETIQRISSMEDKWKGLGQAVSVTLHSSLSNVFLGIEQDWSQMIRRMAADWIAQQALMGIGAAFGGPVGAFISGVTGRASGGPVLAGTPYVVGERGPELFVPKAAGRIVTSREAGGVNLVSNTTVNMQGGDRDAVGQLGAALDRRDRQLKAEISTAIRRRKI